MSGSGREYLSDVQEWFETPPGCPGVVGRISRMSGSGLVTLPNVRKWSGDPAGCLRVVGKPSQMSGKPSRMSMSGWEALPVVWQ